MLSDITLGTSIPWVSYGVLVDRADLVRPDVCSVCLSASVLYQGSLSNAGEAQNRTQICGSAVPHSTG